MDEQRIDNCIVPVDKRAGATSRGPALAPMPDRVGRAEDAPANALCWVRARCGEFHAQDLPAWS